jgi:hypothetical protein
VLLSGATSWAASEGIELIQLERVAQPAESDDADQPRTDDAAPNRWPDAVPGAFLEGSVFEQHWLTFGCGKKLSVFFNGSTFYESVEPEKGRSIVRFSAEDDPVISGFCWPKTEELLKGKTYLAYFPMGSGHVVAFAGDPNYRAMFPGLQRLFINACFFGPGQ